MYVNQVVKRVGRISKNSRENENTFYFWRKLIIRRKRSSSVSPSESIWDIGENKEG